MLPAFFPSPKNSFPPAFSGGYIQNEHGHNLRYAVSINSKTPQLGTVIVLQGYGDYIEKYFETITELSKRGFYVATFDWFGQGGSQTSGDNYTHVKQNGFHFQQKIADFSLFLRNIIYPDCPPPYYLLGYDMGALLAMAALDMVDNQFNRLLCISPLLAPFGYKVGGHGHIYHHILSDIGLGEKPIKAHKNFTNVNYRQTDHQQYIKEHQPHFILKPQNSRFVKEVLNIAHKVKVRLQKHSLRVPTLFILASQDKISNDREVRKLCDYTRHTDYLTIKGVNHDILQSHDHHRQQFWAAFDAFIPGSPVLDPKSPIEPASYDLELFY